MLVESLVFPRLRYCLTVWGSCTATQKRRVQKVIHFGARIAVGLNSHDHVTPALEQLGWRSVDDLISERDIAAMRSLLTAPAASELARDRIVTRATVSTRTTRATEDGQLELPRVRTEFARRGFLFRATKLWNTQPLAMRANAVSVRQTQ